MSNQNWDMYDYIVESKDAVNNIIEQGNDLFASALSYCETKEINQIYVVGSGTSYHAALAAKGIMEKALQMKVNIIYPLAFKDNEFIASNEALVIGVSHAGRSSSTIKALDYAREKGMSTIAMTVEMERPIRNHADETVLIAVGEELAGPKTKGFIGSIATLALFSLLLGVRRGTISEQEKEELVSRMKKTTDQIPELAEKAWKWYKENKIDLVNCRRMIVIGYENCVSAMMEGTLKISEAVRYSVIGYEQEEFMHGIYHGIDAETYILYLAPPSQYLDRCVRMKDYFAVERKNHNYLITSEKQFSDNKNFVFDFINDPYFMTMEYIVPLQVIARKLSLDLGIDCNQSSDPDFHRKMESYTY